MNEINFIPKTDIEEYFNVGFNIKIYKLITEREDWIDVFEPLEFLNLMYEQFEVVAANLEKPLSVKNHLFNLELNKDQLFLLLYCLNALIMENIRRDRGFPYRARQLQICWNIMEYDYKKLEDELFEAPVPVLTPNLPKIPPVQPHITIKPVFNPETIPVIFDLLKDFFSPLHQTKLKQIMETGNDASEQLIFLGNGNRLADAFKQLIDSDIITGCRKNELESWICRNFQYRNKQTFTAFQPEYLQNIISSHKDLCQNPILNVTTEKSTGKTLISKP